MRASRGCLLLAGVMTAVVAGEASTPGGASAQSGPIKIGFLSPLSGAVKSINGKVEDRAALIAALRKVKISHAPRGPVEIDAYGNPTQNIYVRKVEKVGGKLQNTVIHTFPRVSQFWKYNPEEFLKQPVYSRDFPPCKHC